LFGKISTGQLIKLGLKSGPQIHFDSLEGVNTVIASNKIYVTFK